MERLVGSIRASLQGGNLPSVPEERRVEQSLFPARLHPKCALLDEQLLSAWAQVYGTAWSADLERMRANNIAALAGFFWPNSKSDARTVTLIKVMQWFTIVDDAVDDLHAPQADKLCHLLIHHVFNSPQRVLADHPLHRTHEKEPLIISVGLEWWKEIQATTPPAQQARIAAQFTNYLLNQVAFIRLREKPALQAGLEEYRVTRRNSSGFPACLSMIEYDLGIELDDDTLRNPLLQQLHIAACDHAACINDILSFPKEFGNGDLLNVLALLHMRNNEGRAEIEEAVPFQEAVSEAWRMAQAHERDVARLAKCLRDKGVLNKAAMHSYVETVCSFASGIWAWTVQSPRYKVPCIGSPPGKGKSQKALANFNAWPRLLSFSSPRRPQVGFGGLLPLRCQCV